MTPRRTFTQRQINVTNRNGDIALSLVRIEGRIHLGLDYFGKDVGMIIMPEDVERLTRWFAEGGS